MHHLPVPIPPQPFTDAAAALAQVQRIYESSIAHLRAGMQRFVAGDDSAGPVRAFYPLVRVRTGTTL
ncbi:MAG: AMP nucleosidase, partial [bacterium]